MDCRHGIVGSSLLGAVIVALAPEEASACGGMFCDAGPVPMPVDQTGENILFVRDGTAVEAHIQIQYVGEAAEFGWVIPLQSVPEFEVGSEPLFRALLAGTVPTYGYTQTFDDCNPEDSPDNATGLGTVSDPSSTMSTTGAGDDGGGGPQIILTETVGAFEITVLEGGTGQEVFDWLEENGYDQDEEALPILDAYVAENHLFAAVRLTGGAGIDEIHPIALRFSASEPCIPLRLTRIAAVENMAVRSFFLGEARTVPRNYRHVLVNPIKVDWINPTNYNEVVTLAVDEENANGRAFVTEYAGPSTAVSTSGVFDNRWQAGAFATLDASLVGAELESQGLLTCDFDFGNGCTFTHPLVESLLAEYVTPPDGVAAADYWSNQASYGSVDLSPWDGNAFAAAFADRIVDPGQHASMLIADNPYLTRMFTTISPAEMTEDPEFHENTALPEVPNLLNGTLRNLCNGDQVFTVPDGREIYLPSGTSWPDLPDEPEGVPGAMPSAELVEEVPANGAPMRLTDNTAQINRVLEAWNAEHDWPGGGTGDDAGGCGCSTTSWPAGAFAALVLLALRRGPTRGPRARDRSPAADR